MFLPEHGEPREVFVRWRDETGSIRSLASRRETRPDLAAALNDPAAQFAGYRVEVSKAILLKTQVALYQVYTDVVIEVEDFGAQALKRLESTKAESIVTAGDMSAAEALAALAKTPASITPRVETARPAVPAANPENVVDSSSAGGRE
jgi:hypothetical protein